MLLMMMMMMVVDSLLCAACECGVGVLLARLMILLMMVDSLHCGMCECGVGVLYENAGLCACLCVFKAFSRVCVLLVMKRK